MYSAHAEYNLPHRQCHVTVHDNTLMSCDSTWQHTDDVIWQYIDNDINTTLILHDSTGTTLLFEVQHNADKLPCTYTTGKCWHTENSSKSWKETGKHSTLLCNHETLGFTASVSVNGNETVGTPLWPYIMKDITSILNGYIELGPPSHMVVERGRQTVVRT